jgi:hypothetical protein
LDFFANYLQGMPVSVQVCIGRSLNHIREPLIDRVLIEEIRTGSSSQ